MLYTMTNRGGGLNTEDIEVIELTDRIEPFVRVATDSEDGSRPQ